ncbi:MAG: RecX family transcriptional regulator, partial [Ruminococcus sp.]|nr:RecX family transcriptional regulator [Ruminococcus sp.]
NYKIVDDDNYARLYIKDCLNLKGWGKRRILAELALKGIDRDKAEMLLENTGDIMLEKAKNSGVSSIPTSIILVTVRVFTAMGTAADSVKSIICFVIFDLPLMCLMHIIVIPAIIKI